MAKRLFFYFLSLFFFASSGAQMYFPEESNSDCHGAIVVNDTIFGPTVPPEGFGKLMETTKNPAKTAYALITEHNSLWYKITAHHTSRVALDIKPVDANDDFDFIIFQSDGSDEFCKKIVEQSVQPYRANLSKAQQAVMGRTGLSFESEDEFVQSTMPFTHSKYIDADKGDIYYLVVDNFSNRGKGHTLHIYYSDSKNEKKKGPKILFNVRITDEETGKPAKGDIEIIDMDTGNATNGALLKKLSDNSFFSDIELPENGILGINCNAHGYFFFDKVVITKQKPQKISVDIKLKKINIGEKLTLQNINFVADMPELLPSCKPSLDNLLSFMQHNSTIHIEIQGHVNGPNAPNTKEMKELSGERAKAVFDYLVNNNIEQERIEYKGYGNKEMIYPKPANDKQQAANRRVDILVTGL